ncbi:MAG: bifunctional N(6)-L-threonylcarbamoyladenine synthase/serine/threonine protein kinase [Candidatus Aenigmarchaeota archaeon]|nr:bifunctional N(6)-L-threonylcarbamoyladenine synthase/serine/threonine protein kinase [Candidatus Aenigmarchaeota archaeon]
MICLGIEATAHTFGVGIVSDKGGVLADARDVFRPKAGWGLIPIEVASHHKEVWQDVLNSALERAKLSLKDIGLIAFSQGPGLPPCLKVGLEVAKKLSSENKIPIIPVNHCIGHIEIGKLQAGLEDPVTLYVSGGNTQVISLIDDYYRVFGETQDIGIGNALDKFGRETGLDFPAGPKIESLAKKGKYIELPYVVKGMDLSFSGIVTEALRKSKNGIPLEDLCFSLQETMFAMLTEVTERALAHVGKNEVMLTGGVAANHRLGEMLDVMCRERGARFRCVQKEYSGDNGSMIGLVGMLMYKSGNIPKDIDIKPRQRTDDVEVTW